MFTPVWRSRLDDAPRANQRATRPGGTARGGHPEGEGHHARPPGNHHDQRPRIVITEHDQILLDTADPATYTILDHAADLLAALGDDLAARFERDLEQAAA